MFEIAAGTSSIATIATFNSTNGANPLGNLVMDAQGNLYGTTAFGGANGLGTVFEISGATHALTTIATFNGTNGQSPTGLSIDAQGNLYGTTTLGGAGTQGTAFEIAAGSNAITTLATFNTTNGAGPMGGLVRDAQGNLYGITSTAGPGTQGTVFEIAAGTHTLSTIATFNYTNGANPVAGLTIDAQGNLYGTTLNGGPGGSGFGAGDGTVFEISALTHALTTLVAFNYTNRARPRGGFDDQRARQPLRHDNRRRPQRRRHGLRDSSRHHRRPRDRHERSPRRLRTPRVRTSDPARPPREEERAEKVVRVREEPVEAGRDEHASMC